jgi:hypothetical protein
VHFIIVQSGGAGVAVFTLEALARSGAAPVAGVILLDASLSEDYDLTAALSESAKGIADLCSIEDVTESNRWCPHMNNQVIPRARP